MESWLAEFLPDLLILVPPHRDYSFVLKLLLHPPDSDCSLHPPSYSAGSLASRGLHSSGRNRKHGAVSADWGWGQCALKAWEKPATPLQAGQSLERSGVFLEEANGHWFYCVKRTPNHVLDRGKSMHRTSEDRGTMANKRVYRNQGWLYVLRLQIQGIEEVIPIALNLTSLTLPASSRESLKAQRRKHWDYFHFRQMIRVKEKTGEVEKPIQLVHAGRPFLEGFRQLLKRLSPPNEAGSKRIDSDIWLLIGACKWKKSF